MKHYILGENGNPIYEPDEQKWDRWFSHLVATGQHVIFRDTVDDVEISTIFLGHAVIDVEPPPLWQTQIFGGVLDQSKLHCAGTRESAHAMHTEMVNKVKKLKHNNNQ
jgi:hypothetical protein